MSDHSLLTGADIHIPYRQVFVDAAARTSDATVYTVDDLFKKALQEDTKTEYFLDAFSPTNWEPVGAGGGSGHVIQDEGTPLATQPNLNFAGAGVTVTDDAGNSASLVTIPGGTGDVVGPAGATTNNLASYNGGTGKVIKDSGLATADIVLRDGSVAFTGDVDLGTNDITNVGLVDGVDVSAHAARHENGGADEIDIADLAGVASVAQKTAVQLDGSLISTRTTVNFQQSTNVDITVTDNVGQNRTDVQISTDADVKGPAGPVVDEEIAIFDGTTGKVVKSAGEKVTDLLAIDGTRAMAADLNMGSQDITTVGTVNGVTVENHSARHENGGADEISIAGLSGEAADPQPPKAHAADHLPAGSDPLATAAPVTVTGPTNAAGTDQSFSLSDHEHALALGIGKAGVVAGSQPEINFEEGTDITLVVANDIPNNRVNVTINGSGGEVNTTTNDGSGVQWAKPKVGVNLPFRSFLSEVVNLFTLTQNTNENTIDSDPLVRALSSGMTNLGGVISINGGDAELIDITAGAGQVLDPTTTPADPQWTEVSWTAFTAETLTFRATDPFTTLMIDNGGLLVQVARQATPDEFRTHIILGIVLHVGNADVESVSNSPTTAYDVGGTLYDLMDFIGLLNRPGGNVYSPNGANLELDRSSGSVFGRNLNRITDPESPNVINTTLATGTIDPVYTYRDGSGGWIFVNKTVVDPDMFDDGTGSLSTIPTNDYTIQRIYYAAGTDETFIEYGQDTYANLADAQAALDDNVEVNPDLVGALFRAWMIVKEGVTVLDNLANTKFITNTGTGGGGGGGAGSGDVVGPGSAVNNNFASFDGTTGKVIKDSGIATADAILRDGSVAFTGDIDLGTNAITNVGLVDGVDVSAHAVRHENGGADEISVAGLSGLLADDQNPTAHAADHISGAGDEVDGDRVDIDFVPSTYTRSTVPAEVTLVVELTAHLAGIDNALTPLAEANTASNAGTGGIGVFSGKVLEDLEFNNIISDTGSIAVTLDGPNKEVNIEVVPGIVDHNSLNNLTVGDPHTQYQQESEKGAVNGYASLDADTKVPLAQAPVKAVFSGYLAAATAIVPGGTNLDIDTARQAHSASFYTWSSGTAVTIVQSGTYRITAYNAADIAGGSPAGTRRVAFGLLVNGLAAATVTASRDHEGSGFTPGNASSVEATLDLVATNTISLYADRVSGSGTLNTIANETGLSIELINLA